MPLWQEVSRSVPPADEVVRAALRMAGSLAIGTMIA
jgi:hypothetical protein